MRVPPGPWPAVSGRRSGGPPAPPSPARTGWTPRLPRAAGRRPGRRRGDRCRGRAGCLSGSRPPARSAGSSRGRPRRGGTARARPSPWRRRRRAAGRSAGRAARARRGGCRRPGAASPRVGMRSRRTRCLWRAAPPRAGHAGPRQDAPHRGAAEGEAFVLLKQLGEVGVVGAPVARGGEAHDGSRDGLGDGVVEGRGRGCRGRAPRRRAPGRRPGAGGRGVR